MNERFQTEHAICSTKGARPRNEDYAVADDVTAMCLADGIGGEPCGEAFARLACQCAATSLRRGACPREAVQHACDQAALFAREARLPKGGAALLASRLEKGRLDLAWVGDVAAFVLRGKTLSLLNEPCRKQGRLTNAAGMPHATPRQSSHVVANDDRYLLCTDGVWDELCERDIRSVLIAARTPDEAVARLVLRKDARDNATAIALFLSLDDSCEPGGAERMLKPAFSKASVTDARGASRTGVCQGDGRFHHDPMMSH